jgi:hypothetical protein
MAATTGDRGGDMKLPTTHGNEMSFDNLSRRETVLYNTAWYHRCEAHYWKAAAIAAIIGNLIQYVVSRV